MTEEVKKDLKGDEGGEADTRDETIAKLSEQVANLNKGIATYRDEAKNANEVAKAAIEKIDEMAKSIKESKFDDVELTPEDQKKFDAWAARQGFVSKDDLEAERIKIASQSATDIAKTAVSEFLEKHPEYDDDEKWDVVQAEFMLYRTPTDLPGYRALLERVHKSLGGSSSEKEKGKQEAQADIIKRKRLSLGGGHQGGSGNDPDAQAIDSLQKRYPNLSREQIQERLSEINALPSQQKK